MTLPAFASIAQFDARIPGGVASLDQGRAQAALEDASALIRAEAGKTWVTDEELDSDIPDIIVTVCIAAARRAFVNPDAVKTETDQFDQFSHARSFDNASSDVYLKKGETQLVRQAAGKSGLWVQPTTRGDVLETNRNVLDVVNGVGRVDDQLGGDPIAWYGEPDL